MNVKEAESYGYGCKCSICGYELGVHRARDAACPGDDPYDGKEADDRKFKYTTFEPDVRR